MLVRQDDSIVDSGRDSALLEDFSPLQIGTTGTYVTRPFTLVGRLQVQYDDGMRCLMTGKLVGCLNPATCIP